MMCRPAWTATLLLSCVHRTLSQQAHNPDCSIVALFSHLQAITSNPDCRSGCLSGHGACPNTWTPGALDTCSAACGRVFEPFWDECGDYLVAAGLGGMAEMGSFYNNCLQTLYPPGSCGTFCNSHTYQCYASEVSSACCDQGGRNCQTGHDVPNQCTVGCAIVFPQFLNVCRSHISSNFNLTEFTAFENQCTNLDGVALIEYTTSLVDRGCEIILNGRQHHRRALQDDTLVTTWLGRPDSRCAWDDVDDIVGDVSRVCCANSACSHGRLPQSCAPSCAVSMHTLQQRCGQTLAQVLGANDSRLANLAAFERQCYSQADAAVFMEAIEHAHCPDDEPQFTLYVARASGDSGFVSSMAGGNHLQLNGVEVTTLQAGGIWQGSVQSGDIITATGPIYGVVQTHSGTHVMIPDFLKGREFGIANSRRSQAELYINCLSRPCQVTISTSAGVLRTADVDARSYFHTTVAHASGTTAAITVSSTQDIVMAISDGSDADYMPIPPVSEEQYGIASTVLSLATVGADGMTVSENCSDASMNSFRLPGAGHQLEQNGYSSQYNGKACRYTSTTIDNLGRPRTFAAHGYADGTGGDSTPFLHPSLFSTEFVTPIAYEFLAFVSDQPGTVTVNGVATPLTGTGSVYKARVGAGSAGTTITSTVPVWAVMEAASTRDENLLYGVHNGLNQDLRLHRLFVAMSNGDHAVVGSIADNNELYLNGVLQATLGAGDIWRGAVHSGDIFTAGGPIYGVVQTGSSSRVMVPGRLRGKEFAIGNSRRTTAVLEINCLEQPCHVTISTDGGVVQTIDIAAETFRQVTVTGAAGSDKSIVVSSSSAIVMAVTDSGGTLDYMPVPPVSAEQFGIASTVLSVATEGWNSMDVTELCSDTSTRAVHLPGSGQQVEQAGYSPQYLGKACRYTSDTISMGRPRTFAAHGYGDGDGGDSTPFLPRSLFSTEFVTPIAYEFLAFASDQPGTVTVNGVATPLTGTGGVYKARVGQGGPGELISSTVPVWAVIECAVSQDENLLYGNIGSQPVVDIDQVSYRLFVARANETAAVVVSLADGNELVKNGQVLTTLANGQSWHGNVSNGDIFTANAPIYGVVRDSSADGYVSEDTYVMIPGRLKGKEFAIPNDRRNDAHLYVYCLEVPCHITASAISSSSASAGAGVLKFWDMEPNSFADVSLADAHGSSSSIVVSSTANIVLAIGNSDNDNYQGAGSTGTIGDYMPVPPTSTEQFGIPSTALGVAGIQAVNVTEECDDGSVTALAVPTAGQDVEVAGYASQYTGKACRYTSMTMDSYGRPETFGAGGFADGDGGDSTPFLPRSLFSTEFVTPIAYEFLAFVSDQPGTVTVNGVATPLTGTGSVYKARVGAGSAGTTITSTVPVWAVLECAISNDENLLYGNIGDM